MLLQLRGAGWRLAVIDAASTEPDDWTLRVKVPSTALAALVPEAVNVVGDYAVALAAGNDFSGYLVRWRLDDLAAGRLGSAEWWTDSRGWMPEIDLQGRPTSVVRKFGPEASLHFEQGVDRWVLVWTEALRGRDPRGVIRPSA